MMNEETILWMGSESSYHVAQEAIAKAALSSLPEGRGIQDYVNELVGPVYRAEGSVGVVHIRGSLISGSAGFGRLYGVLGYDDIRAALTEAVADKNVQSILMFINSPGGAVAGVQDLSNYIADIDKVKPVLSYTEMNMASAALWLGLSARQVMASQTAIVGSIGTLIVHMENTKELETRGVKATVIRSGKYKALGGPLEPLSELARAEMQSKVDYLSGLFVDHVAARRGVSASKVDSQMGQGREFIGQQAVDVGMVDAVGTFQLAHSKAASFTANANGNQRKPLASAALASQNTPNLQAGNDMKLNLTPEQLGLLATGTPLDKLGLDAETLASAQAAMEEATKAAAAKNAATPNATTAANEFLRTELRETQTELATTNAKLVTVNAELVTAKDSFSKVVGIARSGIAQMQIALGQTDTSAAVAEANVVAEHERLGKLFAEKFPGGRVSQTSAQAEEKAKVVMDPMMAALLKRGAQQY